MLTLVCAWLLLGGCSLAIGSCLLAVLDTGMRLSRVSDRAIISTWLGLLLLANLYLLLSLLFPLTPVTCSLATLPFLMLCLPQKGCRLMFSQLKSRLSPGWTVAISLLVLAAAAHVSQVIVIYDSGLYHVQEISWLSQYGLVPGLAHIESRFGYPSSWFTLAAPFNSGLLEGRMDSATGGFVLVLTLLTFIAALMRWLRSSFTIEKSFLFVAFFLLLPIQLVWGILNSPSPDPPVLLLGIMVAWLFLVISELEPDAGENDKLLQIRLLPLILAVGAVSIKLNAAPLVAVAALFYLQKPSLKKVLFVGFLVPVLLIPFAAAGIDTSGFPFYPASFFHVNVPWSMRVDQAVAESQIIKLYNRWGGDPPAGANDFNWIVPWISHKTTSAVFVLLSVVSALLIAVSRSNLRGRIFILWTGVIGILLMVVDAPDVRFGLTYCVMLIALALAGLLSDGFRQYRTLVAEVGAVNVITVSFVLSALVAGHIYVLKRPSYKKLEKAVAAGEITSTDNLHCNLWYPPHIINLGYQSTPDGKEHTSFATEKYLKARVADVIYFHPANGESCWDAPLPCARQELQGIRLRDPSLGIGAGFVADSLANLHRAGDAGR